LTPVSFPPLRGEELTKAGDLVGAQLATVMAPVFKQMCAAASFEEDTHPQHLLASMVCQTFGELLASSPAFDPLVKDMGHKTFQKTALGELPGTKKCKGAAMSEIKQLAQQFWTILDDLVAIFEKKKQAICRDDWELMQKLHETKSSVLSN